MTVADIYYRTMEIGDLDRLEPLWSALLEHHRILGGELPFQNRGESWRLRRRSYRRWLAGGGFGLMAEADMGIVGYAMVSLDEPDDTWDLGPVTAELQTLVVASAGRNAGVGTELVRRMDRCLARRGIADVLVGVVATNVDAIRFYERLGWRPSYTLMHRPLQALGSDPFPLER